MGSFFCYISIDNDSTANTWNWRNYLNVNYLNEWNHLICSYNKNPDKFQGYKNGKLLSDITTNQIPNYSVNF